MLDACVHAHRLGCLQFIIEPHVRFPGLAGEQKTMFFKDCSNNNLEFKVWLGEVAC